MARDSAQNDHRVIENGQFLIGTARLLFGAKTYTNRATENFVRAYHFPHRSRAAFVAMYFSAMPSAYIFTAHGISCSILQATFSKSA